MRVFAPVVASLLLAGASCSSSHSMVRHHLQMPPPFTPVNGAYRPSLEEIAAAPGGKRLLALIGEQGQLPVGVDQTYTQAGAAGSRVDASLPPMPRVDILEANLDMKSGTWYVRYWVYRAPISNEIEQVTRVTARIPPSEPLEIISRRRLTLRRAARSSSQE